MRIREFIERKLANYGKMDSYFIYIRVSHMRRLLISFIGFYVRNFSFPFRGQKFLLHLLKYFQLLDHAFIKKTKAGFLMKLANVDHIERELFWYGAYEEKEGTMFINFVTPECTVLDIGANIGLYSLLTAHKEKECTVYAFEPSACTFNKLTYHIQLNHYNHIKPVHAAAGKQKEQLLLHLASEQNRGMTGFKAAENATGTTELINVLPVDEFILQHNLQSVTLVKIDVEGYELQVLEGMKLLLATNRPVVAIEISGETLGRYDQSTQQVYDFFEQRNYIAYEAVAAQSLQRIRTYKDCNLAFFIPSRQQLPAGISVIETEFA